MGLDILFKKYLEESPKSIIELRNRNREPVAALYLNKIRWDKFTISETNNTEKYYLYMNGIAIFFTYFKKID